MTLPLSIYKFIVLEIIRWDQLLNRHPIAEGGLLVHGSPLHPSNLLDGVIKPILPQTFHINQNGERVKIPHDRMAIIATSLASTWFPLVRAFFHEINDPGDEKQWAFTLMKTGEMSGSDISPFMVARNALRYLIENGRRGYLYGLTPQTTQRNFTGQTGMQEIRLEEPAEVLVAAEVSPAELPSDLMVLDTSPEVLHRIKHTPFENRPAILQSAACSFQRLQDVYADLRVTTQP